MRLWREIKDIFSEDVSLTEMMDPTVAGARMRRGLLMVRECWRAMRRDDIFNLAASLAFKTLLAIVPVLAICLAVLTTLDATEKAAIGGAGTHTYTEVFITALKDKLPSVAGMDTLIAWINDFADNARTIATVGFIFLFWTAFSLLGSMESALNTIWQVRERRARLARFSAFLTTLVIVPVLMVASVFIMAYIQSAAKSVLQPVVEAADETPAIVVNKASDASAGLVTVAQVEDASDDGDGDSDLFADPHMSLVPPVRELSWNDRLSHAILVCASILMTCAAMTMLLYLLPFTVVRLRSALAGGLLAGLMFEMAKLAFRYYAGHVLPNYTAIYGQVFAVPLFLVWTWFVWICILIGAVVSFTVQNFRDLAEKAELEKRGIRTRLYLAVRVVERSSWFFHRGEYAPEFVDRVADELKTPPYMIREIVNELVRAGILRKTIPDEDSYVPAKDIHELTVREVCSAIQADRLDVPGAPDDAMRTTIARLFAEVNARADEILGGQTFAALVATEDALPSTAASEVSVLDESGESATESTA